MADPKVSFIRCIYQRTSFICAVGGIPPTAQIKVLCNLTNSLFLSDQCLLVKEERTIVLATLLQLSYVVVLSLWDIESFTTP